MWASTLAVPTFFTIFLLGALFGFFQQIENYGLNYINQGLDIYVILPLIAIVLAILGFFGLVRGLLYKHDLKTMILLILGLIAYMPLLMAFGFPGEYAWTKRPVYVTLLTLYLSYFPFFAALYWLLKFITNRYMGRNKTANFFKKY